LLLQEDEWVDSIHRDKIMGNESGRGNQNPPERVQSNISVPFLAPQRVLKEVGRTVVALHQGAHTDLMYQFSVSQMEAEAAEIVTNLLLH
jgi:hypothetical protein